MIRESVFNDRSRRFSGSVIWLLCIIKCQWNGRFAFSKQWLTAVSHVRQNIIIISACAFAEIGIGQEPDLISSGTYFYTIIMFSIFFSALVRMCHIIMRFLSPLFPVETICCIFRYYEPAIDIFRVTKFTTSWKCVLIVFIAQMLINNV